MKSLRDSVHEIISKGRMYRDTDGGLHIEDYNAFDMGDCYFLGQHMIIIAKSTPIIAGIPNPIGPNPKPPKSLEELREAYEAAMRAEYNYCSTGDAAADEHQRKELEAATEKAFCRYHMAIMAARAKEGHRPPCCE